MAEFLSDWAGRLPKSLGKIRKEISLKNKVWFRVGGAAEVFCRPQGEQELSILLKSLPQEVPVTIIGMGSNLLVREGGIPGLTIQLGAAFGGIEKKEDSIIAGAAVLDRTLSLYAASEGMQGFEFLIGVPGALGGAIRMNAGAYGQETQDLVQSIRGVTRSGEIYSLTQKEIGFSYRCSQLPEGFIVTEVVFKGQPGQKKHILEKYSRAIDEGENLAFNLRGTGRSTNSYNNNDDEESLSTEEQREQIKQALSLALAQASAPSTMFHQQDY